MLAGDNVQRRECEAGVYSKEVYTRCPVQGSLYGFSAGVIKECILGAIEARFGPLRKPAASHAKGHANGTSNGAANANGAANGSGAGCKPGTIQDCCADGIME